MNKIAVDFSIVLDWCFKHYPENNDYLIKLAGTRNGLELFIYGVCNILFNPIVSYSGDSSDFLESCDRALWSFQKEGLTDAGGDSLLPCDIDSKEDVNDICDYFTIVTAKFLKEFNNSGVQLTLPNQTNLYITSFQAGLIVFDIDS